MTPPSQNLYDQLQLIQILDRLPNRHPATPGNPHTRQRRPVNEGPGDGW